MKNFGHRFLIVAFLFFAFNASAIVVPNSSAKKVTVSPNSHKLSLKEKAALWILRKKVKKQLRKQKKLRKLVDTTDCDQILLKTEQWLDVRIIKISDKDVRFVRCGDDTTELVLSKDEIQEIRLSDGVSIYKNTDKKPNKTKSISAGKVVLIILGAILASLLLGFLLLWWLLNAFVVG